MFFEDKNSAYTTYPASDGAYGDVRDMSMIVMQDMERDMLV
jgi:hypothetical protein